MPAGPWTFHHPVGAASGMQAIGRIEARVKEERRNE
jgi:hypothetical protein